MGVLSGLQLATFAWVYSGVWPKYLAIVLLTLPGCLATLASDCLVYFFVEDRINRRSKGGLF